MWIPMCIYDNISSLLLIMRNISDKSCKENQKTFHIVYSFFLKIVPFMRCEKIWYS